MKNEQTYFKNLMLFSPKGLIHVIQTNSPAIPVLPEKLANFVLVFKMISWKVYLMKMHLLPSLITTYFT